MSARVHARAQDGEVAPRSSPRLASNLIEELWFGEDDPEPAKERAKTSLAAQMALVQGLLPFPVAATRLIHILANPDFEPSHVVGALESDPGLAAKTLRVANSPLFRTRTSCLSLFDAIRRLGARHVRDIAIGVSTMSMYSGAAGRGVAFRDHSVGVGAIARVIAEEVAPAESSPLFLAGLLHEIGKLLLVQTGEMSYTGPLLEAGEETDVIEREVLGYDHAVLGGCVMKLWRIPDPIADLVAWHHQPARAMQHGGPLALMVAVLRSADRIEAALSGPTEPDEAARARLAEDVAWSYGELNRADLEALWPRMREARAETLGLLAR